jgi:hypothetical protein
VLETKAGGVEDGRERVESWRGRLFVEGRRKKIEGRRNGVQEPVIMG